MGWLRHDSMHRRWARWTWPLWVYVSISGVVVYLMLHHLYL
jgi:putative membrane protein